MNPALIALVISLVEETIKISPGLVADIQAIFSKSNPTPADWEALRAKVLAKSYADYVPASALPASTPVPALPAGDPPSVPPNVVVHATGVIPTVNP